MTPVGSWLGRKATSHRRARDCQLDLHFQPPYEENVEILTVSSSRRVRVADAAGVEATPAADAMPAAAISGNGSAASAVRGQDNMINYDAIEKFCDQVRHIILTYVWMFCMDVLSIVIDWDGMKRTGATCSPM